MSLASAVGLRCKCLRCKLRGVRRAHPAVEPVLKRERRTAMNRGLIGTIIGILVIIILVIVILQLT